MTHLKRSHTPAPPKCLEQMLQDDVRRVAFFAVMQDSTASLSKASEAKKIAILQVIRNELPPPHSHDDFFQFLKSEHCEENLKFLEAVHHYEKAAKPYFPHPLHIHKSLPQLPGKQYESKASLVDLSANEAVKPQGLSQAEFEKALNQLRDMRSQIKKDFLSPDSPMEINLTSKLRKPLMDTFQEDLLHPEHFEPAYDHIVVILKSDAFRKFLRNPSAWKSKMSAPAAEEPKSQVAFANAKQVPKKKGGCQIL
ncbi:RGS domain-containing protein [Gorgonomyces haynaldii]|nr:RGS domain-containing protein [Gorgonomyces haynaldii]